MRVNKALPDSSLLPRGNKTKASSKSPAGVTAKAFGADASPDAGKPVDMDIYSAIHVYKRVNETDGKVRWNANHEREMHGPGTLVFCHTHSFGQPCDSGCKVKVEAE